MRLPFSTRVRGWAAAALAIAFVGIQFKPVDRTNPPEHPTMVFERHLQVDPPVAEIIDRGCIDCHSNRSRWPWYSHVAPTSWFTVGHVTEARGHMNLSQWGVLAVADQAAMLTQMCEEVSGKDMPLPSYTWIHWSARLSDEDRRTFCAWTERERARLSGQ